VLGAARAGKSVLVDRYRAACMDINPKTKKNKSKKKSKSQSQSQSQLQSQSQSQSSGIMLNPGETCGIDRKTLTYGERTFVIREVGYPMRESWEDFLSACRVLLYVVDISDTFSIPSAAIGLLRVAMHHHMAGKPIVIVLNKTDLSHTISRGEMEYLLRIPQLQKYHSAQLDNNKHLHNYDSQLDEKNKAISKTTDFKLPPNSTTSGRCSHPNEENPRRSSSSSSKSGGGMLGVGRAAAEASCCQAVDVFEVSAALGFGFSELFDFTMRRLFGDHESLCVRK